MALTPVAEHPSFASTEVEKEGECLRNWEDFCEAASSWSLVKGNWESWDDGLTDQETSHGSPPPEKTPLYDCHNSCAGEYGRQSLAGTATNRRCSNPWSRCQEFGKKVLAELQRSFGARTTLVMKNIPRSYSRERLLALLSSQGFTYLYDFVYLPRDSREGYLNLGYAIVNAVSHSDAKRLKRQFQHFSKWEDESQETCQVSWLDSVQGYEALINRYRNCPWMHEVVPVNFKPLIFFEGTAVTFPPPTKKLRMPCLLNSNRQANYSAKDQKPGLKATGVM
jgi:hypothetical protein